MDQENIILNCKALSFQKPAINRYTSNFSETPFTHVISTAGAYQLPALFPFADTEKLKSINQLEYAKVVQVSLGFREWKGIPLNAFGGLVPFKENRNVLGVLFLSSFLKNKAPEKGAQLSVFLGGIRKPEMVDLDDQKILKL